MATKFKKIWVAIDFKNTRKINRRIAIIIFLALGFKTWSQNTLPLIPERFFTIRTSEGTYMDLDVSQKDNSIIFSLLGNIFYLKKDGGVPVQLTKGIQWDSYPVFSPDGETIAFISDRSGVDNIHTMNLSGGYVQNISKDKIDYIRGSIEWMPSGNGIRDKDTIYNLVTGTKEQTKYWPNGSFNGNDGYFMYDYYLRKYNIVTKEVDSIMEVDEKEIIRPVISPDGRYFAYVTLNGRSKPNPLKNGLKVYDLKKRELLYKKEVSGYQGYFTRFSFDKDSENLIIPYGGKIHKINIQSMKDTLIPFHARIEMEMGPSVYHKQSVPVDSMTLNYLRFGNYDHRKKKLYFSAISKIYSYDLETGKAEQVVDTDHGQFYPVLTSDGDEIIYSSWDKTEKGYVWSYNLNTKKLLQITEEPGLYKNLAVSESGRYVAFTKGNRKYVRRRELFDDAEILIVDREKNQLIYPPIDEIPFRSKLDFLEDKLFFMEGFRGAASWNYVGLEAPDFDSKIRLTQFDPGIYEIIFSHDGKYIAYVDKNVLYLVNVSNAVMPYDLSTPSKSIKDIRVSNMGVVDPFFSKDGQLSWLNGNRFFQVNPESLLKNCPENKCSTEFIQQNSISINIIKPLQTGKKIALTGAKILTMDESKIIQSGTIIIEGGRVKDIGSSNEISIPVDALSIDVKGKTIIPGLIDMHIHHDAPPDVLVDQYSKMLIDLAFGITTMRDPAAFYHMHGYKELAALGKLEAPRIIPFLALSSYEYEMNSYEDALAWIKKEKQRGAIFIKIHDSWSRKKRQWLIQAANQEHLNITAHPDFSAYHTGYNISAFLDGLTGLEHPIPIGENYLDFLELVAQSKTWYLLAGVSEFDNNLKTLFKGLSDKEIFQKWHKDSLRQKIMNFEGLISGENVEPSTYYKNSAEIANSGGNIALGSHGNQPGLPFHIEMWQHKEQGIDNYKIMELATFGAAKAMGLDHELGSLEVGKIADLIVLDGDPLENIRQTANIEIVIKNGNIFNPDDLFEEYFLKINQQEATD